MESIVEDETSDNIGSFDEGQQQEGQTPARAAARFGGMRSSMWVSFVSELRVWEEEEEGPTSPTSSSCNRDAETRQAQVQNENVPNEDQDDLGVHPKDYRAWIWDANIIYVLPFFCTIATRLPFIYFVIQLEQEFGISFTKIGIFIGLFHLCRVVAIAGALISPKVAHLIGTLAGVAGYTALLITGGNTLFEFAASNIAVGLAEASAAVNVYAKNEFGNDMCKLRMALSAQSTVIGIAVIFGFFFGGLAFQVFDVAGIAVAGIIVLSLELASLLFFLLGCSPSKRRNEYRGTEEEEPTTTAISTDREADDVALVAASENNNNGSPHRSVRASALVTAITNGFARNSLVSGFSSNDSASANTFTYLIATVFSVESIAAGYLFSIGPLFMNETFGTETGTIGIIFSSASLFGTTLTLFAISPMGRRLMKRFLPSPYNLYVLIATITASVLGAMVPVYGVHVLSILMLIGASELFLTLLSELQGAITTSRYYAILGPSGQMFRRMMNVVMATTGPIAYGVFSRLPYLISGCLLVPFTVFFIVAVERQRKQNALVLRDAHERHAGPDGNQPSSKTRIEKMSLATQEVIARMASLKALRDGNKTTEPSARSSERSSGSVA